ncbi:MAG: hypothetical protein LUK37_27405 [Clostridia bacterium]|nr:hypothetical protein [Clostridia bacterium]
MGAKKDENRAERAAKPTQITVMLRLVAGGYLVYLAFGLLQEYLKPAGGGKLVQMGCAVLFGVIGAFLAGWSLKKFIKGEYIKYGEIPDDEEEEDQTEDI